MNSSDLTEHVKHLRAIQFSLLIICIGALTLVLPNRKSKVANAHRDLERIIKVKNLESNLWFSNYYTQELEKVEKEYKGLVFPGASYINIQIENNFTLSLRHWWARYGFPNCDEPDYGESLECFEKFWNDIYELKEISRIIEVANFAKVTHLKQGNPQISLAPIKIGRKQKEAKLGFIKQHHFKKISTTYAFVSDPFSHWSDLSPFDAIRNPPTHMIIFESKSDSIKIELPVKIVNVPFGTQKAIGNEIGVYTWEFGNFDYTFKDLDEVSKYIKQLKVGSLEKHFEQELQRNRGNFKMFGIEIPADKFIFFSLVVIIGLCAYLLLHLRVFVKRISNNDPALDYPWLGIFTSLIDKSIFLLIVVVLPLTVCVMLLVNGFQYYQSTKEFILLLLAALIIVFISLTTIRVSIDMWRKISELKADNST